MATNNLISKIARFHYNEGGPTTVEYAVLMSMVAGMAITAIIMVGDEAQRISEDIAEWLDVGSQDQPPTEQMLGIRQPDSPRAVR
jgi:Flp pilus assembly pilin Flp